MTLANRLMGPLGVGLLGFVLLAATVEARTNFGSNFAESRWVAVGLRGGAMLASGDLDGVPGIHTGLFMRLPVVPKVQVEIGGGYGRYVTEDYAWVMDPLPSGQCAPCYPPGRQDKTATDEYHTDLSYVQMRLLLAPVTFQRWAPYVYGGVGYTYFDIDELTPRRGNFDGIGRTLSLPVGVGVRFELSERIGLEASGGLTFTRSDRIDEANDYYDGGSKKDHYMEGLIGLTYDIPCCPLAVAAAAPVVDETTDTDGDGLTDFEERTKYFTNALVADSDNDGLKDGEEVHVYRTDPNRADTDGGTINDGVEVGRGTDPLNAADDVPAAAVTAPAGPTTVDFAFPTAYFAVNRADLSAADKAKLDLAARVLGDNPGVRLYLHGHADITGKPASNLWLSWWRAYAVKDYLSDKGIDPWRLTAKGHGDRQPAASNATRDGRAKNRRTELEQIK